jgi:hypothetical protein
MTAQATPAIPPPAPIYKDDPIGWQIWYLENNLHLYKDFRRRADQHAEAGKLVRANRIVQELRFETQLQGLGAYRINDHAAPFFVRVYLLQRPGVKVEIQRKGYWKDLSSEDRRRIRIAFNAFEKSGRL